MLGRTEEMKDFGWRLLPSLILALLAAGLVQWLQAAPALGLMVTILTLPALFILAWDQPLSRQPNPLTAVPVLLIAAALLILATGVSLDVEPLGLATWLVGPALLCCVALWLGRLARLERAGQLLALALPSLVVFAPFLADPWLLGNLSVEERHGGVAFLIENSTWAAASADLLALDLFKNEQLYREFRIGEQLYAFPAREVALKAQFLLAGAVFAGGGLVCVLRRLSSRLLSPST